MKTKTGRCSSSLAGNRALYTVPWIISPPFSGMYSRAGLRNADRKIAPDLYTHKEEEGSPAAATAFTETSYRRGKSGRAEWVSYLHRRCRRVASLQDVRLERKLQETAKTCRFFPVLSVSVPRSFRIITGETGRLSSIFLRCSLTNVKFIKDSSKVEARDETRRDDAQREKDRVPIIVADFFTKTSAAREIHGYNRSINHAKRYIAVKWMLIVSGISLVCMFSQICHAGLSWAWIFF